MQDESCIAAHLGERAPKGAEDESASQEQQDDTEQGGDHDESVDGTGAILAFATKLVLCSQYTALKVNKEIVSCVQHTVKCQWCSMCTNEWRGSFPAQLEMMLGLMLTSKACQPLMSYIFGIFVTIDWSIFTFLP